MLYSASKICPWDKFEIQCAIRCAAEPIGQIWACDVGPLLSLGP